MVGNESVSGHTKPKGPAPVQVGGVDCSEHPLVPISLEHPMLTFQERGLLFGQWPPLQAYNCAFSHLSLFSEYFLTFWNKPFWKDGRYLISLVLTHC